MMVHSHKTIVSFEYRFETSGIARVIIHSVYKTYIFFIETYNTTICIIYVTAEYIYYIHIKP